MFDGDYLKNKIKRLSELLCVALCISYMLTDRAVLQASLLVLGLLCIFY